MTASAWGSWLITAFVSWHSAGTVTAKSTWVSCNQYWIGYTLVTQATGRCTDSKKNKHINIQAKTFIFYRDKKLEHIQTPINYQTSQCGLVPDGERVPWCEDGVITKHWLGWKVSRQSDSRALKDQGDVAGQQLGGLGGKGDEEKLAIAVDFVTQEFH